MSNLFVAQDHFFQQAKRLKYVARSAFKLLEIQKKHQVIKPKGARVLDLGCAPGAWLQVACQKLGCPHHGGLVVGVDIQHIRIPSSHCDERVRFLQGDAFSIGPEHLRKICPQASTGFTTVLSDMCPATSGQGFLDVQGSLELAERAAELALGRANFEQDVGETDDDIGRSEKRRSDSDVTSGRSETGSQGIDGESGGPEEESKDRGLLLPGGNFVVKLLEGSGTRDFGKRCKPLFEHVAWLRPQATRAASREIYLIALKRLEVAGERPHQASGKVLPAGDRPP